ncbi:hypothetical protein SGQ83_03960 [Flavobacterium sp. Fl-318]|uniref:Uncharacterized protein n=1 Tax=Flavobacterium cupriresistens TaxID=2893885 RepID=A0ABU4R7C8_9FLAO|nr:MULTISPECIES: hypothetical protein [unclassified Flavobacterium]MDX6188494.1 hypothetical protein [Flavobacterium sp. Fl-318]UFH44835.1 hypothetical protein LNP23_11690 [Flavobacterium sp. F-323]
MRHNDFGFYRVGLSKFTIRPNTNNEVYSIIDTNSVYILYKEEMTNVTGSMISKYCKFYNHGRIAEFYDRNVNLKIDTILEARKGYMGYYNYDGENIIVQFYNSNANSSELNTVKFSVENDTLISLYRGIENSQIKSFFIKKRIPKNIRVTKPDW